MERNKIWKTVLLALALLLAGVGFGKTDVQAKASYTVKKYAQNYGTGERVTGRYAYQMPQLKGNTKAVKKINASLKKGYKASLAGKKNMAGYVEQSNKSPYMANKDKYFSTTTCKVTYNKKRYISFRFHHEWYVGGVHNGWTDGMTFDLKNGRKLHVADVISGNADTVRKKIIDRYFSRFPDKRSDAYAWQELSDTKISDFQFYLKDGKVVVGFGPYQPGGGNGESTITLKRKY